MATFNVLVDVGYRDAANRINERTYMLAELLMDDWSNFDDVETARASLVTALDVLTMDHIEYADLRIHHPETGAAANVAANNQVYAFVRTTDEFGTKGGFYVNAWDDPVYSQDENGLLSAAFNTAAAAVALLTRNPDTEGTWTVDWSQSRGRKMRKKQIG